MNGDALILEVLVTPLEAADGIPIAEPALPVVSPHAPLIGLNPLLTC